MKIVEIPPAVTLKNMVGETCLDENGEPVKVSFRDFLFSLVADTLFVNYGTSTTYEVVSLMSSVCHELRAEALGGQMLFLQNNTYQHLRRVATESRPANTNNGVSLLGWAPRVAHNFAPFFEALLSAKDKA